MRGIAKWEKGTVWFPPWQALWHGSCSDSYCYDQVCVVLYQGGFYSKQSNSPLCLIGWRSSGESDGGNGWLFSRDGIEGIFFSSDPNGRWLSCSPGYGSKEWVTAQAREHCIAVLEQSITKATSQEAGTLTHRVFWHLSQQGARVLLPILSSEHPAKPSMRNEGRFHQVEIIGTQYFIYHMQAVCECHVHWASHGGPSFI